MDLLLSKKFKKLKKQIHSSSSDINKRSKPDVNLSKNHNKKSQFLKMDKEQIPPEIQSFRKTKGFTSSNSSKYNTKNLIQKRTESVPNMSRNITSALPGQRDKFELPSRNVSKFNLSEAIQPLTNMPPVLDVSRELYTPSTLNISKSSLLKKKVQEAEVSCSRHTFLKPSFVPSQKLNNTKTSNMNKKNLMQRNIPPFPNYAASSDMLNRSKAVFSQMPMFGMFNQQSVLQRSYILPSLDKTAFHQLAYSVEENQLITAVSNERFESLIKIFEMFKECPYIDDLVKISIFDDLHKYYIEQYQFQLALNQQSTNDYQQNKYEQIGSWMNASQAAQPEQVAYYPLLNQGLQPISEVENIQEDESEDSFEDSHSNTSQNDNVQKTGTYVLKNWTVLKEEGIGKEGLKVAGALTDVLTRQIIETNHVSDNIIGLNENNTVRTITCTYLLNMNFVDPTNSIPNHIKKHFKSGKFPIRWKSIAKIWHSLDERPIKKRIVPSSDLTTPVQNKRNNLERTIITRSVSKKNKHIRLGLFGKK